MGIKQKIFYFCPTLIAFLLPFGNSITSIPIAIWLVSSFFNFNKTAFVIGVKNKHFQWLTLFFFLTCLSYFITSNKHEALIAIEVKLSFLLFPFLFFCFTWPIEMIKRTIVSFVSGCFFACVVLIVRASYFSLQGNDGYFSYNAFSAFMHPSYFAMYLVLAIALITLFYHVWFKNQAQLLRMSSAFIGIFIVCIFLCASKMGLLTFFICLPFFILKRFKIQFSIKNTIIVLILILICAFILPKVFPNAYERMSAIKEVSKGAINKTSSESNAVRILIWEQCLQLIQQNFISGTGVGDTNDDLYKSYELNGLTGALEHKLNAHNQYFQTFIGMGIIGFTLLGLITFWQLIVSISKKQFILIIFFLLITLNFMAESMLQTSAGVLFFVFFYTILVSWQQTELEN